MSRVLVFILGTLMVNLALDTGSVFAAVEVEEWNQIIEGSNAFGYDLANQLYDESSNIWMSPFTITTCFALLYPGSHSETQLEIANVSGFPLDIEVDEIPEYYLNLQVSLLEEHDGVRTNLYDVKPAIINIVNRFYISDIYSIKQSYIDTLTDIKGEIYIETDFDFTLNNATQIINDYIADQTNGIFEDFIAEDLDISDWRFAGVTSIYLNGTFEYPFDSDMTSAHNFYLNGFRKEVIGDIHLMHQIGYFQYYQGEYYQFLKFPFNDQGIFILFALPIDFEVWDEAEDQGGLIHHGALVEHAINKLERKLVAVALPKIIINTTLYLENNVPDLGIIAAFDADLANFSDIAEEDDGLYLNSLIHKTLIEMDETGILSSPESEYEIVDDTEYVIDSDGHEPVMKLFKADHPFTMFIIDADHEDSVLFMGEVNNPGIPETDDLPSFDESEHPIWTNYSAYTLEEEEDNASIHPLVFSLLFVISINLFII